MPLQAITRAEVEAMFKMSEGMKVDGNHEGHAGKRHVMIGNQSLYERLRDHQSGGLASYTAFLSFADQIDAAMRVLNAPANDPALENFRININAGGAFAIEHFEIAPPVRMRYAIGGSAQIFPCSMFTLRARKDLAKPRGLHIVSFFGTMGQI